MLITTYIKTEVYDDIVSFDSFDEFYMFYSKYCDKNITKDKQTFYNEYIDKFGITFKEFLNITKTTYLIWKNYNILNGYR